MTREELLKAISILKDNPKLNYAKGNRVMRQVKELEHLLVLELQLLGEMKQAIKHEVYKNSGRMLAL